MDSVFIRNERNPFIRSAIVPLNVYTCSFIRILASALHIPFMSAICQIIDELEDSQTVLTLRFHCHEATNNEDKLNLVPVTHALIFHINSPDLGSGSQT